MASAEDPLADLSVEEQRALVELAQARVDGRVNRRDVLAGGAGAALGAAGLAGLVGGAQADASTSDGDGNVGTPSNRVDVFSDGIDTVSIDTIAEQDIYVYAESGDLLQTIDPSVSTPIADAHAVTDAARIVLPPGTIQTPGNITSAADRIDMVGAGIQHSAIQLTHDTNDLFVVDPTGGRANCYWSDFRVSLANPGTHTAGSAIRFAGAAGAFNIGAIQIHNWEGDHEVHLDAGDPFSSVWQYLGSSNSHVTTIQDDNGGAPWHIGMIDRQSSDADAVVLEIGGKSMSVGSINAGGTLGKLVNHRASGLTQFLHIGRINFEPNTVNSTLGGICDVRGDGSFQLDLVILNTSATSFTVNQAIFFEDFTGLDNNYIGHVLNDGATVNNTLLRFAGDTTGNHNVYLGPSSEVSESVSGSLSNGIACVADLTNFTGS